jgi:hypothetical protein
MLYARLESAIRESSPDQVWAEIAAVLEPLAEGRIHLDAVRHPLGFICLPIVRDDSPEGVCVHYWSADSGSTKPTTSRFHCHSWALLSHVLVGSVGNQRLDLVPGDRYRLFRAKSGRDRENREVDDLEPIERYTGVRCADAEVHHAGDSYELEAGAFHASVATYVDVSVTLVLGRVVPGAEDITLGEPDLGRHQVTRLTLGPGEAQRVAREVLRLRAPGAVPAGSAA